MHFCLLASHATVIDKGQIVYSATIEELKANDSIRQRYLALVAGAVESESVSSTQANPDA